jgi:copper chaperone CopZ
MTCESCINDISGSLYKLTGIQKVEANLKDQLVTVEGTGSSNVPQTIATFVWHGNKVLIIMQ